MLATHKLIHCPVLYYTVPNVVDCCTRQVCGPMRPFDMTICDLTGTEVIHLYRYRGLIPLCIYVHAISKKLGFFLKIFYIMPCPLAGHGLPLVVRRLPANIQWQSDLNTRGVQ